jgi:hypothetical protein
MESMIPEIDGFYGAYYPKECKAVREDIDNKLSEIVREW